MSQKTPEARKPFGAVMEPVTGVNLFFKNGRNGSRLRAWCQERSLGRAANVELPTLNVQHRTEERRLTSRRESSSCPALLGWLCNFLHRNFCGHLARFF